MEVAEGREVYCCRVSEREDFEGAFEEVRCEFGEGLSELV